MTFFGLTTRGLEISSRSLDFTAEATTVAAGNIANAETPGYKAVKMEFDKVMTEALLSGDEGGMAKTDPRHFPVSNLNRIQPSISIVESGARLDGNTVDMETEVTRLAEMDLKYSAYSNVAAKEIGILKSAISLTVL